MDTEDTGAGTLFDNPWKTIIETYFEGFLAFFFAEIHDAVDWTKPHRFLDKELEKIVRDAESRNRRVDELVEVRLKTGRPAVLYIHVEVQSHYDADFNRRMFIYHYRLFDRHQAPVVSLAILGDDRPSWKIDHYGYENFGCGLRFDFPVVKLLDYKEKWASLEKGKNPFAIVVRTHIKALETRKRPLERLKWKFILFKALYEEGHERKEILELFHFMDWMLRLPKEIERQFDHKVNRYEEEKKMRYVTSIEKSGVERGMKRGMEQGMERGQLKNSRGNVIDILQMRFPQAPSSVMNTIRSIDALPTLSMLLKKIVSADSLDDFENVLRNNSKN